jgi:hypothetical protein
MEPIDVLKAVAGNGWRWDLWEFAERLGDKPDNENLQKRWRLFQQAADAIRQLDDQTLAVIVGE